MTEEGGTVGSDYDDETLMAYTDGELPPAAAERVRRAVAADPALAARAAVFSRTRRVVAEDAAAQAAPPVPDAVRDRIRALAGGSAGAQPPRASVRSGRRQPWLLPVAASVALAAGAVAGLLAGSWQASSPGLQIAGVEDTELGAVLDALPSGQSQALPGVGDIALIASFAGADGTLCREFEFAGETASGVSVACRGEAGWDVRFAVATGSSGEDGYAPASALETLDAYLTSIGAGAPMTLDEERAALARRQEQ